MSVQFPFRRLNVNFTFTQAKAAKSSFRSSNLNFGPCCQPPLTGWPLLNCVRTRHFDAFNKDMRDPLTLDSSFILLLPFPLPFLFLLPPHVLFSPVSNDPPFVLKHDGPVPPGKEKCQNEFSIFRFSPLFDGILCFFYLSPSSFMSCGSGRRWCVQYVLLSDPRWQLLNWEWCRQRASFGSSQRHVSWRSNLEFYSRRSDSRYWNSHLPSQMTFRCWLAPACAGTTWQVLAKRSH